MFSAKNTKKREKISSFSLKHQKSFQKKKKINCFKQMTFFAQKLHYISHTFSFFGSFSFFLFCFFLMRHLVVTFRPYPVKRFQHLVELQNLVGWTKKRTDEKEKKRFFLFLYLMAFNFKCWMGIFFYYFIFLFLKV